MVQMFSPGPNTASLYFADKHQTVIYVSHVLKKNNFTVADIPALNEYIDSKQFDDKMTIWLDFQGINKFNNRAMKKIIDNPKTKAIRFNAVTGFSPSMDLKFRCLAQIVLEESEIDKDNNT